MTKKKLSVILLVVAIIVEFIACVLWLVPIAGFIIYLFVCGFAIILSVASIILEKESKLIRALACILFSVLMISLIADGIFVVKFVCGLL